MSTANILNNQKLLIANNFVILGVVLVIVAGLHYTRYDARRLAIDSDMGLLSPSDYSLIILNLPATQNRAMVLAIFEDWHKLKGYREELGVRILESYRLDVFLEWKNERDRVAERLKNNK